MSSPWRCSQHVTVTGLSDTLRLFLGDWKVEWSRQTQVERLREREDRREREGWRVIRTWKSN